MKILWVKVGGLWPINSGGRLRSFHLVTQLARSHSLTVLTTHESPEQWEQHKQHLSMCERVESFFHAPPKRTEKRFLLALARSWFSSMPVDMSKNLVPELRAEVLRSLQSENYDLCIADFMVAVPNVPFHTHVPVVFFAHNVEHMIWKRVARHESSWLKRALLAIEWRKFMSRERDTCRRAALTLAVSDVDRRKLQDLAGNVPAFAVRTGVDVDYFRPNEIVEPRPHSLVFTGSMDWHPNEDAMLFFMDAILPIVRDRFSDVSMSIVGRNPSDRLRKRAECAGVRVTGTVDDIRPFVAAASVYVVPIRIGGGTRLKIFEAMAMARPVVSTAIGAEGLPLTEDEQIVIADGANDFADAITALFVERDRRRRLGANGRQLVERYFSWRKVADEFAAYCEAVVHG